LHYSLLSVGRVYFRVFFVVPNSGGSYSRVLDNGLCRTPHSSGYYIGQQKVEIESSLCQHHPSSDNKNK
jgi:hypothetical protein